MEHSMLAAEQTKDLNWERGVGLGERSTSTVRAIEQSWERSRGAGVSPALRCAPIVLDEASLCAARGRLDWFELARQTLEPHLPLVRDSGHVVTLFDAEGHMLASAGDPHTLARLEDIHFIPGASWAEGLVGTNGPGTALASGEAVHVVGAEHFCEAWHRWHCAAAPLRMPSGAIVGALDVSGERFKATSWALGTARLLASLVEQALRVRVCEGRAAVLARYGELVARYAADAVLAVDAMGTILAANAAARALGLPTVLPLPVRGERFSEPVGRAWLADASLFPVTSEGLRAGACVVARLAPRTHTARAMGTPRYSFEDLVGRAPQLVRAIARARGAATTGLPVLVLGESGVGKEVLAQAIHSASPRHGGPFVAVNCAALPRELVESELFGYVEGAFSGARAGGAEGKFEHAHRGTLFLDEVSELPLPAQAALLRVLQEREVTPVGAAKARPVDARVVAATNRPLDELVRQGRFRLDLFHRLNVLTITLPPLRERLEDLSELVHGLRGRVERETGFALDLDGAMLEALRAHDWPGNVRELENVLMHVALEAQGRPARREHLPWRTPAAGMGAAPDAAAARLTEAVRSARSMAEAAAALGVTRSTLYRQLERLNLRPKRTVVASPRFPRE